NGWDTDQFPADIWEVTRAMLVMLQHGGFQTGGINFDAKLRRNSTDLVDLFYAHIGGMDTFARALKTAHAILEDAEYQQLRNKRYASFDAGKGADFAIGALSLEVLRYLASARGAKQISGRQQNA